MLWMVVFHIIHMVIIISTSIINLDYHPINHRFITMQHHIGIRIQMEDGVIIIESRQVYIV